MGQAVRVPGGPVSALRVNKVPAQAGVFQARTTPKIIGVCDNGACVKSDELSRQVLKYRYLPFLSPAVEDQVDQGAIVHPSVQDERTSRHDKPPKIAATITRYEQKQFPKDLFGEAHRFFFLSLLYLPILSIFIMSCCFRGCQATWPL